MSAAGLKEELRDGVLVLTLASPPQNALAPALRAALIRAVQDPGAAKGVVLAADGPSFSADQPIDADAALPSLADLCRAIADCRVPVVAVLHGAVTGPGAELALAARARLALPSMRVAFAEVTLGLVPSGGASVRLPQLIGAKAALRLLLSGQGVPASEALSLGLVDGVTDTAPIASASRLAIALSAGTLLQRDPPDPRVWQAAVTEARSGLVAPLPAPARIIDCVEAALRLPSDAALEVEATARRNLEQSAEAGGLRAAALAERRGLAIPAVLGRLQPLSVGTVGLVGIAPDLARLAVAAVSREVAVTWVFPDAQTRKAGLVAVGDAIAEGVRAGALTQSRARQMQARLTASEDLDALATAPLLISDRQLGTGRDVPGLPGVAHLGLGGVARAMGLALSPAGRVCEVTLGDDSLPITRATALSGLRRMGLSPVVVGQRPVLGARMADAGRTAVAWMVARGVPRRMILSALAGFGLRQPEPVSMEVPSVLRMMPQAEVLHRWLAALANEGARLLEEGVAKRPSDIDLMLVSGQQFPRWQGGPMYQADCRGLPVLSRDLRAWGAEAALWSPAPLIDRLVGEGRSFAALNDRAGNDRSPR